MCGCGFGERPLGSLGWGLQKRITIIVKAIFKEMSEEILTVGTLIITLFGLLF